MPDLAAPPPSDPSAATRGLALVSSLAALDALAELGEEIDDEWTYVTTLAEAGRARLRAAAGPDLGLALRADRVGAVGAACEETARITDPHRAIDWLSTFPAVVELALGPLQAASEAPGSAPARAAAAPRATGAAGA
jgi:hypothetical protein